MAFKKISDEPKDIRKVLDKAPDPKVFDPPNIVIKKFKDEPNLKKIEGGEIPADYTPSYNGSVFLGRTNNFTVEGDSAYDVAIQNGFVGTKQEWLDSLVGPQGPPGADGADSVPTSKNLNYNVSGQLSTVVSSAGTKTLSYNVDGTLNTVSDSNGNVLKTLTYNIDGSLQEVQVSLF